MPEGGLFQTGKINVGPNQLLMFAATAVLGRAHHSGAVG